MKRIQQLKWYTSLSTYIAEEPGDLVRGDLQRLVLLGLFPLFLRLLLPRGRLQLLADVLGQAQLVEVLVWVEVQDALELGVVLVRKLRTKINFAHQSAANVVRMRTMVPAHQKFKLGTKIMNFLQISNNFNIIRYVSRQYSLIYFQIMYIYQLA
ncbi:Hypothetical_protein [Hexamita inflata]|uniref:Hypothetical_protein n=1 Tax=Hexamita inflata TaxID=28002 RepID=A0AA86RFJ4_9EUKA|nr:Hypothetical protein HINF_LOCUS64701 [Hexamita inflata]